MAGGFVGCGWLVRGGYRWWVVWLLVVGGGWWMVVGVIVCGGWLVVGDLGTGGLGD